MNYEYIFGKWSHKNWYFFQFWFAKIRRFSRKCGHVFPGRLTTFQALYYLDLHTRGQHFTRFVYDLLGMFSFKQTEQVVFTTRKLVMFFLQKILAKYVVKSFEQPGAELGRPQLKLGLDHTLIFCRLVFCRFFLDCHAWKLLPHSVQLVNFSFAWNLAVLQVGPRSGMILQGGPADQPPTHLPAPALVGNQTFM